MTPKEALTLVIERAGNQVKLAEALRLKSQGAIANMVRRGYAAKDQVLKMETLYGVSRYDLRPDIYPRDGSVAPDPKEVANGGR